MNMVAQELMTKRLRNLLMCLWVGLAAGLPIFAGCAGHHTNPHTAQRLDDKVIADNVETALRAASAEGFAHVRITVSDAVVTLRGRVIDPQAKAQASQVAKGVEHVREVNNQVQIRKSTGK